MSLYPSAQFDQLGTDCATAPMSPSCRAMPSIPQDSDTERWFNEEVRPHESALRGYLRHFAPPSDIDDLVQEALIRTIRVREQQTVRSIRGFLFATARNAARDLFRHRAVAKTIAVAEIESVTVLDETPDARELASRNQEADLLRAAIRSLPSRCRTILILRKFEHLSQHEIAERLGIAVHTVEAQLTKALHRCEQYFRKNGYLIP
jgi:RNA polymerase sigma factor (sigma-70 family)